MQDSSEGFSDVGLKRPFCLLSEYLLAFITRRLPSSIVPAQNFPSYSEENANYTTAYKMLNDQPLLISANTLLTELLSIPLI